jgi:hypothetical protein
MRFRVSSVTIAVADVVVRRGRPGGIVMCVGSHCELRGGDPQVPVVQILADDETMKGIVNNALHLRPSVAMALDVALDVRAGSTPHASADN